MDTADNLMQLLKETHKKLRHCVNELCLNCGEYQREHLGACNGCIWKEVREDESRRHQEERQAGAETR